MKKRSASHPGFTMVELLVVISIIALLSALLLPALNGARMRSYDADCANNLRQLGIGLYQYATSHDDLFPVVAQYGAPGGPGGAQGILLDALSEYMNTNSPSLHCKRYLSDAGMVVSNVVANENIGYFYWAWDYDTANATIYALDTMATGSVWNVEGYTTNVPGVVLASDRFGDLASGDPADIQYHVGISTEEPLTEKGTFVLITGGSVVKVAPRD